jgi:hypothetical protein
LRDLLGTEVTGQSAPGLAQVVEQVRELLVVEFPGETGHRLHAFEAGELLFDDAVFDHSQQITRVLQAQGSVAVHRHRDMRLALAFAAVAAGADVEVLLATALAAVVQLRLGQRLDHLGRRRLVAEQVGGHGRQVAVVEVLGAVVHHREHLVEHAALGAHAVLEEARQVRLGPTARGKVAGQQAGRQVAVEQAAAQALVLLQGAGQVARGMALAAVAEHLDHVLPAFPGLAAPFLRLQAHALAVEQVPAGQAHAHVEREAQAGLRRRPGDRFLGHQVGVDGVGILALDQVIGGVGHRRIEVGAVLALALGKSGEELVGAVGADAVFLVRGDVGAVDGAERRLDRQSAGERRAALGGMAGHAVGGAGEVFAALDQRRVGAGGGGQERRQRGQRQGEAGKGALHPQASLTRPSSSSTSRVAL